MVGNLLIGLVLATAAPADNEKYDRRPFAIRVVDDQTGLGVPLVELRTTNEVVFVTDSGGYVAFDEPGLMGQKVYFHVRSHGYEYPADGFGFRGAALDVKPGGSAELRIKRLNLAERLYRITGQGIYRDTTLLGLPAPIAEANLNGQVLGQDSVQNAIFGGKLLWFWGDTNRPSYPLGNFHMPGATSELPSSGGLDPAVGVNLRYFLDEAGFARPTCKMPGDGPTWASGFIVLPGPVGTETLLATYAKIKPPLDTYERGFVVWDDQANEFRKRGTFPIDAPARPEGHPFVAHELAADGSLDGAHVYFAQPFPLVRVDARPESYLDISRYEAFTCLKPGSKPGSLEVERSADGSPVYAWKRNTPPTGPGEQDELIKAGKLDETEALLPLRDVESGKPVRAHGGSVWKLPDNHRWALLFVEAGGTASFLGEVWYAEADRPLGPWVYARKVATHDRYSFYNPKIHDEFSDTRFLYFEGTYVTTFSGNPVPTPRYDYNQIMYRLDRDDPRLALPVAIRSLGPSDEPVARLGASGNNGGPVQFLAPTRPAPGTRPVYAVQADGSGLTLEAPTGASQANKSPLFHAIPANVDPPPASTVPLFEWSNARGETAYAVEGHPGWPGFRRADRPLCRVWQVFGTRAVDGQTALRVGLH